MTLADRIAGVLLEQGPLSACTLAPTVRKRKLEVLEVLHSDPRFVRTGKARASRWSVREVCNGGVSNLPTFTVAELAERWKCEPGMATMFIFGEEGFLERGFMECVDGNGRVRSTGLAAGLFAGVIEAQA